MGIPERKERQRQDLRRQVLEAAEELFVQDGFENVSMRKIADRIEYSATTLYRLFENKADIMNNLIEAGYGGVYERYEEILGHRPDSPWETLRLIISAYVTFALENPNHYKLWFETSQLQIIDGQLRMRHGETSYRVYHTWLERIDECKEDGLFPAMETLEVFQLIWGSVHGMVSLRIHHPLFPWMPPEQHVSELLTLMECGLLSAKPGKQNTDPGREDR